MYSFSLRFEDRYCKGFGDNQLLVVLRISKQMFPSFAPCVSLLIWVQMVRNVARESAIKVIPAELWIANQSARLTKHWVITTFAQGFITPWTHNLLKQHAPVRPTNILARPFHCHATCKFPHIKACEYMARHSRMTVVEDLVTWFVRRVNFNMWGRKSLFLSF